MNLRQPIWPRFLPTGMVTGFATLGPVGRARKAPGTWGSVAGLAYFTVFFYQLGIVGTLLFGALGIYLAVALCGEAEFRLGRRDPGEVVLDELVAIPFWFTGWQLLPSAIPAWAIFLAGFGLFRLFDIVKPFGIKKLQDWPGGWGVVADDIAAAFATCLSLQLLARLLWVLQ